MIKLSLRGCERFSVLFFLLIASVSSNAQQETDSDKLNRFLMTPAERQAIESQRALYLKGNYDAEKSVVVVQSDKKAQRENKLNVPDKISVSSIIVEPSGNIRVRVNDRYQTPHYKDWRLDLSQTTKLEAVFIIGGKRVVVPVGQTYWVASKKLQKNTEAVHKVREREPSIPVKPSAGAASASRIENLQSMAKAVSLISGNAEKVEKQ